jgi:3-oxoacyl-[acyl-carrier protein] reductase
MIIVTGASKGIGRAICERLINNKIQVLGLARDTSNLNFPSMNCDISIPEEVKKVYQKIKTDGSVVTGLINAAGIASMNLALTTPTSTSNKIIQTNLLGTIYCCQIFAPLMLRKKFGRIINFSTIAVSLGLKGESIYAASKSGVETFSHIFAREVSDYNITVNCIAPGPINTDLLNGVSSSQINSIVSQQIITKQFTVDSICDVVEVILDDKSQSLSGMVFKIGGS